MARLEELAIGAGRNLRSRLHAEVVTEEDDVDIRTGGGQELTQIFQVILHQAVEETVRPRLVARQHGQEVIHAEQLLAPLQQTGSEKANDRAVC